MTFKKVKRTLFGQTIDMDGVPVKQVFPTESVTRIDPFLLIHHAKWDIPKGYPSKLTGVSPHPHRGFTPITFVVKGAIRHRDSRGNDKTVAAGGVQWLFAGLGLMHSERVSEQLAQKGGEVEIVQVWLNVPAKHKMEQPEYVALEEDEMPNISISSNAQIRLVAGQYKHLKSKVKIHSELLILFGFVTDQIHSECVKIPKGHNSFLYVISGSLKLAGFGLVEQENSVWLSEEGEEIVISANEKAQFILLSGQPINEKVEQYGPYVMNSQTEILEAMRDYQMGKMGFLIED